eukprot:gene26304-32248_t
MSPDSAMPEEDMEDRVKGAQMSLTELKLKANAGDMNAQCDLGAAYGTGDGVELDTKESVRWLQKSADQGNPIALANLGVCYAVGSGVQVDEAKAAELYRAAAGK